MATLTHDHHCFALNAKRLWLVSGAVHYARIPRELWRRRLVAARGSGLNCIEVPVVWGLHEPNPNEFHFDADLNVREFIEIIGELGMHAIVRLGPFVGEAYDLGGLPSWIIPEADRRLRTAHAPFLSACSRFFARLSTEIASLQATAGGKGAGGPILLVQNEHQWYYGDDELGAQYLGELVRFIRESGIDVPIINRNNLYQSVEPEIDTWSGFANLHTVSRQLRSVRPDHPCLIAGLSVGEQAVWGHDVTNAKSPGAVQRALAETLAGGGQFNLTPFCAGTNFAHYGGRLPFSPDAFATATASTGPLTETGASTPVLGAVKSLSLLASTFDAMFTDLEGDYHPIALVPAATAAVVVDERTGVTEANAAAGTASTGPSVIHARGDQGELAFVFAADDGKKRAATAPLLMQDGSIREAVINESGIGWVLMNTHLYAKSVLDLCTLSAVARHGRVFVCAGPAGATGTISINGSEIERAAPEGPLPDLVEHEDILLAICNETSIEHLWMGDGALHFNAAGLNDDLSPIQRPGEALVSIQADGTTTQVDAQPSKRARPLPKFGEWTHATTDEFVEGESARYAAIPGPSSMESLGAPSGYGWLRLVFKSSAAKKVRMGVLAAADRLHMYLDGQFQGVAGVGPGAMGMEANLPCKKREHTLTIMVDNLGRTAGGVGTGEYKGVYGHLWEVAPLKLTTPKTEEGEPLDPTDLLAPFYGLNRGETTSPDRLTWRFTHRKRTPVFMVVAIAQAAGVVVVNGEPLTPLLPGCLNRIQLDTEILKRGANEVQIALMGDDEGVKKNVRQSTTFYEGVSCLSEKASWAFATWRMPTPADFEEGVGPDAEGRPRWWRTTFGSAPDGVPLQLDVAGLSKGTIYLNGRNIGRYFAATPEGQTVPPQRKHYLPEPWLNTSGENVLTLFDEHGFRPEKVKLVRAT